MVERERERERETGGGEGGWGLRIHWGRRVEFCFGDLLGVRSA